MFKIQDTRWATLLQECNTLTKSHSILNTPSRFFFTLKTRYDYKSQRFNKYNSQSYLVFNVKKNLDGVFSMECDFVKVLHPCKSVAHLVSWILNIYIYWKFGVGEYTHQYTSSIYLSDRTAYILRRIKKKLKKNNTNWAKTLGYSLEKPCSRINIVCGRS